MFLWSFILAVGQCFFPTPAPFDLDLWEEQLADYWVQTDQGREFRGSYIFDGLANGGFDIGIPDNARYKTGEGRFNSQLSFEAKYAITNWVASGLVKGHVIGPYSKSRIPFADYVISPLFTVPKPSDDLVKKHRIIHHLSYDVDGEESSVNDILEENWKHVSYTKFTEVVELASALGPGAYLWTVDAQDAYYRVPIKRKYWHLMGFKWLNQYYFFTSLQMGLSSACKIYTRFADAVEYIIIKNNFNLFHVSAGSSKIRALRHYLDDFFGGSQSLVDATDQFNTVQGWFVRLGIPTKPSKCVAPSQKAKILGWIYNTVEQMVSVPADKAHRYSELISDIIQRGYSNKKELEKVIGKLQWASLAIFPGKAFIRRLEKVLHTPDLKYGTKVVLSNFVIEDLKWWLWALKNLNGLSFFWLLKSHSSNFDIIVWTDASSKVGMGGWSSAGVSFQLKWSQTILARVKRQRHGLKIQFMELLGLVVAAKIWAPTWKWKTVEFRIDNTGACHAVKKKAAALWREDMNYLIRVLAKLAVEYKFKFWVTHVNGELNGTADALSRFYDPKEFELDRLHPAEHFKAAKNATLEILQGLQAVPLNGSKQDDPGVLEDSIDSDPWHAQF